LPSVSADPRGGGGQARATTPTVAESQRLCGALGALRQGRMSLTDDPVRGSVTPPCADTIRGAFSSRAESSTKNEKSFYVAAVVKPWCVFFLSCILGRSPPWPRAIFRRPLMPRVRVCNAFLRGQVQRPSLLVNSVPRLR